VSTLLLIHGGLWDDMDADRFWHQPGIVAGLQHLGFEVIAPNRVRRAPRWAAELDHLTPVLPEQPFSVLGGSNGCTVAVRLASAFPEQIERLLLAWPATAGDPGVDTRTRAELARLAASPETIDTLLAGQTLRGVTDHELATITQPTAVLPSMPANPYHQRRTIDALCRHLPHAVELPGCPEPPRPDFPPRARSFIQTITGFLRS
jgi:pimeloyl-ACP methyl ester carboxylesterase